MTWLAWRQLRTQAGVAALAVIGVLVVLAVTGPHLHHVYDAVVVPCAAHRDCASVTRSFFDLDAALRHLWSPLMLLAPILFGIFFGAPLVARELETGTFRLAWTQSVTRTRWIVTRLVLVALAAAVLTGLLSAAVTWWQRPIDLLDGPFPHFDARNIAPVAYTLFAVSLGALFGAVARRTVVAMAAAIVGYAGVRFLVTEYVRPHLFAPRRSSSPFRIQVTPTSIGAQVGPPRPSDWVVSDQVVTGTGRIIGQNGGIGVNGATGFNVRTDGTAVFNGVGRCPNRVPVPPGGIRAPQTAAQAHAIQAAIDRCVASFHLKEIVTYQPPSRYWPLQWSEAAIFVALAVALGAVCVWLVRRRLP